MKKILTLFAVVGLFAFSGCSNDDDVDYDTISEVFQLNNVNFDYNAQDGFNINRALNPAIYKNDVILIYRKIGTITSTNAPIWEQIPKIIYLSQGRLSYDFEFSNEHFIIYAEGNYDLELTPDYLDNQTFRIVIVPGDTAFSGKSINKEDYSDYNAVIKKYNIDDSKVKNLN
ncbi:hypothetical protein B0A67_06875 [Flavobacterium aquidurense]|jgi:hypothetical protein|uniref:hypothetical protein n=1 Tax=Flavobacterium aquidurense TaxID=362413 RepID=UPI000920034B|nr:hypothetical protein [Flavobacterium aquidurense]OXA72729.1 hypothetical protein B0A67_06875 [Flavobacterium aquidurense]SHG28400.1 hypothetical protein SAMN05444481_103228 [Flavobacterium frigidimaris]